MVRLQPDPFLNELTSMFERTTEKGSVWVTLKHSSDKSKAKRNKMKAAGEKIEFRCLIRATDGKKTLSTMTIVPQKQYVDASIPCQIPKGKRFPFRVGWNAPQVYESCTARSNGSFTRTSMRQLFAIQVVASGLEDTQVSSSQFQDFSVTTCCTDKANELKVSVDVSGTRTQSVFDDVFSKMVADAQPIPGFRRVKGGKTPDIPKDILLEILGPSKVYMQVIKRVISTSISEYVEREGVSLGKDLQVLQSFADLEAAFQPGENFRFEVILRYQDSK